MPLLGHYPTPRVIIKDKLRSYTKPIRNMCKKIDHRSHKGLNNRVENAYHLSLMGKIRNIFSLEIGHYIKNAADQRLAFNEAKSIWDQAAQTLAA